MKKKTTKCLLLAAPRGFCAGVKRAVEITEAALRKFGAPVYCLNEIVHNRQVVAQLSNRGVVFVNKPADVPDGGILLFSAHGVTPQTRTECADKNLRVIDATCPFVDKVHREVRAYAAHRCTIFLIGKHGHDEVAGVAGEAPDHVKVIETEQEARQAAAADPDRVATVTQTTLSDHETATIKQILTERFPQMRHPDKNDICYATRNRQKAVQAIAQKAQAVLVLGSENSSNSRRLVEVAKMAGVPALLVPDLAFLRDHLPPDIANSENLGLTAGASVPETLIADAIEYLREAGYGRVEEISVATEQIDFPLPRELR